MMRRFILAPDSFKGTMTAREICDILEDTVKALVPEAETVKIPMSHGVDSLNVAAASAVAFWQLGKR